MNLLLNLIIRSSALLAGAVLIAILGVFIIPFWPFQKPRKPYEPPLTHHDDESMPAVRSLNIASKIRGVKDEDDLYPILPLIKQYEDDYGKNSESRDLRRLWQHKANEVYGAVGVK